MSDKISRPRLDYWNWWHREGRYYDPDFSEVPWFDKRKFLAEKAFDAGVAQGSNYTADAEIYPQKVAFANGRTVCIKREGDHIFLDVSHEEQLIVRET